MVRSLNRRFSARGIYKVKGEAGREFHCSCMLFDDACPEGGRCGFDCICQPAPACCMRVCVWWFCEVWANCDHYCTGVCWVRSLPRICPPTVLCTHAPPTPPSPLILFVSDFSACFTFEKNKFRKQMGVRRYRGGGNRFDAACGQFLPHGFG